jgi:uncharacterized protein (DUF2236 family)
VHAHSQYAQNPWGRLARTMTALYSIVHGTRAEADRVAAQVRAVHRHVRGQHRGRRYSAFDSDLMLWVHATLVDTGIAMHDAYVRPLASDECADFYDDMKVVAQVFGVPRRVLPRTYDDFRAYEERMLAGVLRVGDDARAIAETITRPPVPLPLRPALRVLAHANIGLLPAALREQYGFTWRPVDRAALVASARAVRTLLPLAPAPVRDVKRTDGRRDGLAFTLLALASR